MNSKYSFLLAILITIVIANTLYIYNSFNSGSKREEITITRVIDGDTFESENNIYRLININTPERGEKGYSEALFFLKNLENHTIEIEPLGLDKYSRTLVKVYSPVYINLELVKKGLAKKFLVQENELKIFLEAEEKAIDLEEGIWHKSAYFDCLSSEIDEKDELVHLKNNCKTINLSGWILSDESRKKYKFEDIYLTEITLSSGEGENDKSRLFWGSAQGIWNNNRDTLYLFDNQGNIAHYHAYGY